MSLVLLLQARGRMTASELAAELEISVRTVYRDLEALSTAGVPVYAEPGPHGGCQLIDGYRFPLRPEEAEALLLLGVPPVLRDLGLGDVAPESRRSQHAGGAHETRLPHAGPASSRALVHLDMPGWFRSPETVPALRELADALRQNRMLELTYSREGTAPSDLANGSAPRSVAPLGLVNKAGIWYLVAMTKGQQPTVFRATRITSARVTTEPAGRPAGFDLAGFWQQWSREFAGSRPRLPVTVRVSPLAQAIMPEIFGDAIRTTLSAATAPDTDGWRELTLTFEHEHAAAHRLAGFGAEVEVVSPPQVRDVLVTAARGILARYPGATDS
jgi:predicted DNA-binding transcriptional regulator YafY